MGGVGYQFFSQTHLCKKTGNNTPFCAKTNGHQYKTQYTDTTAPTRNGGLNLSKWGPNEDLILSEMGTKRGPSAAEMGTKWGHRYIIISYV